MTLVDIPDRCPQCGKDEPTTVLGTSGDGLIRIDVTCKCGHRFEVFAKTCKCCRRTYDRAGWNALPSPGHMDGGRVELRNCSCGATLAIEVRP